MKNWNSCKLLVGLFSILPIIMLLLSYPLLSENVAASWSDGAVSYTSKSNLWIIVFAGPLVSSMFYLLPKIDPRKANYKKFTSIYETFAVLIAVFLAFVNMYVILFNLGYLQTLRIEKYIVLAVGLLFVLLGNGMPKLKSNYFMGIRNPWTLANESVWNRTHRLGGYCFMVAGLVMLVGAFFLQGMPLYFLLIGVVAFAGLLPTVKSYFWFRAMAEQTPPERFEE